MTYNLRDVVTDGALTAPRLIHHAIKLATHAALTYLLLVCTGRIVDAALLAGPGFWLLITAHERIWPSDRQPLTLWQHVADWMTDLSLATLPVAGALIAIGDWIAAALILGACVAAYLAGHTDARP